MSDTSDLGDELIVEHNGEQVAVNQPSGLEPVAVPDPNDPPRYGPDGELEYPGGVLLVAAPVGSTVEEASALLGEPGEVKGPSPTVWGEEHAAAFGMDMAMSVVTPQGDGEPVKGPAEDRMADEVVTEPQE